MVNVCSFTSFVAMFAVYINNSLYLYAHDILAACCCLHLLTTSIYESGMHIVSFVLDQPWLECTTYGN